MTELLCKKNICANYFNQDGKLPKQYITKPTDRRLQFIRQAESFDPSRPQKYGPILPKRNDDPSSLDELSTMDRPSDRLDDGPNSADRTLSMKEQKKLIIKQLIESIVDPKYARRGHAFNEVAEVWDKDNDRVLEGTWDYVESKKPADTSARMAEKGDADNVGDTEVTDQLETKSEVGNDDSFISAVESITEFEQETVELNNSTGDMSGFGKGGESDEKDMQENDVPGDVQIREKGDHTIDEAEDWKDTEQERDVQNEERKFEDKIEDNKESDNEEDELEDEQDDDKEYEDFEIDPQVM